jgi:hypothetical protein
MTQFAMKKMLNRSTIREAARALGRKGGRIGGKRSLVTMTREARVARARKAARQSAIVRRKQAARKNHP